MIPHTFHTVANRPRTDCGSAAESSAGAACYVRRGRHAALVALAIAWAFASAAAADASETRKPGDPDYFNRVIRPILSENCFQCHGPDSAGREAGLRLDRRDAAVDHGAIVSGDPDSSLIVERVRSDDPDLVMPPPEAHRTLTARQKDALAEWIQSGAAYQKHWAFEPIRRSAGDDASIDGFIGEQLKRRGLTASPPASKERWLRRVTLDLTGLPPTLDELDAFLADASPDAFERVVDRLLASPRCGERLASEWLDAARYSDTYGYQVDRDRYVWPWRDWLVRAFNRNLPYDQFITEQLAGDLLPGATEAAGAGDDIQPPSPAEG